MAVFGWMNLPEIEGYQNVSYAMDGWLCQCVALALASATAVRDVKRTILGFIVGVVISHITRWGVHQIGGLPETDYFYLAMSIIETGLLFGIYVPLSYGMWNLKILLKCSVFGFATGCFMALVYLPYLWYANGCFCWGDLAIWAMFVWVTTPLFVLVPSVIVEAELLKTNQGWWL